MIYDPSPLAVSIFFLFVGITLGISFYLGSKAKSSAGYFAAHGQIPWFVNGIAFAGDYLSAASFLGICGMIAYSGYDGFLYSIGYLAGWIVALFVVAEPMKRLGKYTFADALNVKFQSRGIKVAAGISTLVVSTFYLIPQMVGAGALITPLLGFPHWVGVVLVGSIVILIVVTAGMVSTTWVQFIKGALLVVFSMILTMLILQKGLSVKSGGTDGYVFRKSPAVNAKSWEEEISKLEVFKDEELIPAAGGWLEQPFIRTKNKVNQQITVWKKDSPDDSHVLFAEGQFLWSEGDKTFVNGLPLGKGKGETRLHPVGYIEKLPDGKQETGKLTPFGYLATIQQSDIVLWKTTVVKDGAIKYSVYYPQVTAGSKILSPGENKTFAGIRSPKLFDKLNFLSLMLALFAGTASLPHILIRYYTVKDESSARKSTIVGIATIGTFYILTLFMGLGAMTSGALDLYDSNMSAPLLARSLNETLFAIISAIAFTTVLGTVSGLILAAAGAVAHDLVGSFLKMELTDVQSVRIAKVTSVIIGIIAIVLGILFKSLNVNYLVGWAFSIAASANLPALIMILFWSKATKQGVATSILVGMLSSLIWILMSQDTYAQVYKFGPEVKALVPFSQPGIVTIPLGFLTLVLVSLITQPKNKDKTAKV